MKRKNNKPVMPIYLCAAAWLLLGAVCPGILLTGWGLAASALLSAAVYFVSAKRYACRPASVFKRDASCVQNGNGSRCHPAVEGKSFD